MSSDRPEMSPEEVLAEKRRILEESIENNRQFMLEAALSHDMANVKRYGLVVAILEMSLEKLESTERESRESPESRESTDK